MSNTLLAQKGKGLRGVKTNTCKVCSLWDGKLLEPNPIPSQHVAFLRAASRWLCGETDGTETYRDKHEKFAATMQRHSARWDQLIGNRVLKKNKRNAQTTLDAHIRNKDKI